MVELCSMRLSLSSRGPDGYRAESIELNLRSVVCVCTVAGMPDDSRNLSEVYESVEVLGSSGLVEGHPVVRGTSTALIPSSVGSEPFASRQPVPWAGARGRDHSRTTSSSPR
ncbi:MAG: hypothetical protein AAF658_22850, partial [Myxococcota bacterium]